MRRHRAGDQRRGAADQRQEREELHPQIEVVVGLFLLNNEGTDIWPSPMNYGVEGMPPSFPAGKADLLSTEQKARVLFDLRKLPFVPSQRRVSSRGRAVVGRILIRFVASAVVREG